MVFTKIIAAVFALNAFAGNSLFESLEQRAKENPRWNPSVSFRTHELSGKVVSLEKDFQEFAIEKRHPSARIEIVNDIKGKQAPGVKILLDVRFDTIHERDRDFLSTSYFGELRSEFVLKGVTPAQIQQSGLHFQSDEINVLGKRGNVEYGKTEFHRDAELLLNDPTSMKTTASTDPKTGDLILVETRKLGKQMSITRMVIGVSKDKSGISRIDVNRKLITEESDKATEKTLWSFTSSGPFKTRSGSAE